MRSCVIFAEAVANHDSKTLAACQESVARFCDDLASLEVPKDAIPKIIEELETAPTIPHKMGRTTADYPSINMSLLGAAEKLRLRIS